MKKTNTAISAMFRHVYGKQTVSDFIATFLQLPADLAAAVSHQEFNLNTPIAMHRIALEQGIDPNTAC